MPTPNCKQFSHKSVILFPNSQSAFITTNRPATCLADGEMLLRDCPLTYHRTPTGGIYKICDGNGQNIY